MKTTRFQDGKARTAGASTLSQSKSKSPSPREWTRLMRSMDAKLDLAQKQTDTLLAHQARKRA